jgi:hypothetical protein
MKSVVYDTGVLIGAERNERNVWAEHRVRLGAGNVPLVPAPVVAQASRSPKQAQLRRFLRGCEIVPLDEERAHRVGSLLGKSRTTDVVDGSVVALAVEQSADIVSDDDRDIRHLVAAARSRVKVHDI